MMLCRLLTIVAALQISLAIDWDRSNAADPRWGDESLWGWWSPSDRDWARALKRLYEQPISPPTQAIPKRIHQIWLGSKLPERFAGWGETWRKKNPGWSYRLWTDADVPNLRMRNKAQFDAAQNLGEKSDILRLEIIDQFGGVYADTDFECVSSLGRLHARSGFYAGLSNVGYFEVSNGIFAALPGHPVIRHAMQYIATGTSPQAKADGSSWVGMPIIRRTGPGAFTRAVMEHVMSVQASTDVVVYPVSYFFPTPNILTHLPTRDEIRDRFLRPESHGVHHWAATWIPQQQVT